MSNAFRYRNPLNHFASPLIGRLGADSVSRSMVEVRPAIPRSAAAIAGKTCFFGRILDALCEGATTLALGQKNSLQEDIMAAPHNTRSMKSVPVRLPGDRFFLLFVNLDGIRPK